MIAFYGARVKGNHSRIGSDQCNVLLDQALQTWRLAAVLFFLAAESSVIGLLPASLAPHERMLQHGKDG